MKSNSMKIGATAEKEEEEKNIWFMSKIDLV